jgi:hypothetical protein
MFEKYGFCAFSFKVRTKRSYDPKMLCKKINLGIKNADFLADFKFVDAGIKKCS